MQERFDIEEAVRRSLQARAADVTPDPATWRRVQAGIRRRQLLGWVSSGLATAGVAAVLAVLVLPAVRGPDVRFDVGEGGTTATPPAERLDPGATAAPPRDGATVYERGGVPCDGLDALVGVVARDGDLSALCAQGGEAGLTAGAATDGNPAVAPDVASVVFERMEADGGAPVLVSLDLRSGEESVLGGGRWPAFAADGRLAWIMDAEGDGQQPLLLVGRPFDEPEVEVAVGPPGAEELTARHLAFDAAGERLVVEAGYEGSALFAVDLAASPPVAARVMTEEGAVDQAPDRADQGAVSTVHRCCVQVEGDVATDGGIALVRLGSTGAAAEVVAPLPPGFGPDAPVLAWAGGLRAVTEGDGLRWEQGEGRSWVVGDGLQLWSVADDGTMTALGAGSGIGLRPSTSG